MGIEQIVKSVFITKKALNMLLFNPLNPLCSTLCPVVFN